MDIIRKLLLESVGQILVFVALGFLISSIIDFNVIHKDASYPIFLNLLLAIGLFASVTSIDIKHIKSQLGTIIFVTTFGVFIKVAFIGSILYLIFGKIELLIFAPIIAQIDPLSVGFLLDKNRSLLSEKVKSLFISWASFDDPITVIITILLATFLFGVSSKLGVDNPYLWQLGNIVLPGVTYIIYRGFFRNYVATGVLIALTLSIVAYTGWMLAAAIVGLFLRAQLDKVLQVLLTIAYAFALTLVGTYLGQKFNVLLIVVIALSAIMAQFFVAYISIWGVSVRDKLFLQFGQQNGITAIILGLYFEQFTSGVIVNVAFAVILINMFHALSFGVILWKTDSKRQKLPHF